VKHPELVVVIFEFRHSFDGVVMMEVKDEAIGLLQYDTIHLPTGRRRDFWLAISRLGVWQWPHDTMPLG
jgi:hypothetical protein